MLSGKTVIVTGAASGIGEAITRQCLAENALVIACDIDQAKLTELSHSVSSPHLETYLLDVTHYPDVVRFFTYIEEKYPAIDSLVNNAGIYLGKNILDYDPAEMDRVLDVNVKGFLYGSQLFGRILMKQQRNGVILNMSSVSGLEGSSDAVYGLSKAAILGLTKSCAMNFAPYIRVNAITPTMVDTSMMDTIPDWRRAEYREHELINQPVLPVDVAHTVTFLLSDMARHYTGATFDLNNGCYLR